MRQFLGKSQVVTIMWWNGFLFHKFCVKLKILQCLFILFTVFCGVLLFVVCFFHGLCTCSAQLIPFLCVKNLVSDHLKVIPIKFLSIFYIFNGENLYLWHLKSKLYILILSGRYSKFRHKTHGDSFMCIVVLDYWFFSFNHLMYTFLWYYFSDVWSMCSIKTMFPKNYKYWVNILLCKVKCQVHVK